MRDISMGASESRFAELVWQREPISTKELTELCLEKFQWKKSTTYTVLKRLSEKGLFKNEGGIVTSLMSEEEYYENRSTGFVKESFGGSLPAFLAAFTSRQKLSKEDIDALKRLIEESEG